MLEFLLPVFGEPPSNELKQQLWGYANEFLYDEDYKNCGLLSNTTFFNEPFACVDSKFVIYALESSQFTIKDMKLLNRTTNKVTVSRDDVDIEITSRNDGSLMKVEIFSPLNLDTSNSHKTIVEILEGKYGIGNYLGSRANWLTGDDMDIHMSVSSDQVRYAFINRNAYPEL